MMKFNVQTIKQWLIRHPDLAIGVLIFLTCVYVYLANDRLDLGSTDNIPHSLLAFNWLQNHSLHFDAFRGGYLVPGKNHPYFFAEGLHGHLTSRYPMGTALITFPLYVLFYLYLKIVSWVHVLTSGDTSAWVDITSASFSTDRKLFAKLAGTLSTALTAVLFYISLRLKFNRSIALIATFIFAFATLSWALCSQDLRQHTISNLVVVTIMLCLLKANRTTGKKRHLLLLLAGIFCGLLPSVRLTSGIFSLAATLYAIYTFRQESISFLLGLPSVLLHFAWNLYYFGPGNLISGGYVEQFEVRPEPYRLTWEHFRFTFPSLLFSPSEGLFTFSPVLLFAIPGFYQVFKRRAGKDEQLILGFSLAAIGLLLQYCFYGSWMGGAASYGGRFLTDIIPVISILVAYAVASLLHHLATHPRRSTQVVFAIFLISVIGSTGVQAVGVFTSSDWEQSPIAIGEDYTRVWQLRDSYIERHFRNLVAQVANPIPDPARYSQGLDGTVEQIEIVTPQNETIDISAGFTTYWQPQLSGRRRPPQVVLRAIARNTGQSQWFGYQSGLYTLGETKLRVHFINQNGKSQPGKWLNISGIVKPGEQAEAVGRISFPRKPGQYQMAFDLMAKGLEKENQFKSPIYSLNVTILSQPPLSSDQENPLFDNPIEAGWEEEEMGN